MPSAASGSTMRLCDWLGPEARGLTVPIRDIHIDSRCVEPGDAFIAVAGEQRDGRDFLRSAVEQGAAAVVVEADDSIEDVEPLRVPVVAVKRLQPRLGELAARFYATAQRSLPVIGVTGTNGKTSITYLLAHLLHGVGQRCAVLGTLGWGFADALQDTGLTTPDIVSVHRILARLAEADARYVAMEVSSHGLSQGRVDGLDFSAALFTNLSRDHLDYHGDMASYGASKRALFLRPMALAVFNLDDDFGADLYRDDAITCARLSYSRSDASADIHCSQLQFHSGGCSAVLTTPWGEGELHSPLLGPFNLLNLLACIALLGGLGFDLSALLRSARSAVGAPGRMQLVHQGEVRVIVDYAHTPDALEQVLQALRPHVDGHLHLVFGCGGNRDVGKRPLMGAIAESLADRVVVTSDNPRDELPEAIVDGICGGMQCLENITIEVDRGRAIRHALGAAVPGDMVVIAGKGHESYQEISGERRPFSDRQCVEHYYASPARAQR